MIAEDLRGSEEGAADTHDGEGDLAEERVETAELGWGTFLEHRLFPSKNGVWRSG